MDHAPRDGWLTITLIVFLWFLPAFVSGKVSMYARLCRGVSGACAMIAVGIWLIRLGRVTRTRR